MSSKERDETIVKMMRMANELYKNWSYELTIKFGTCAPTGTAPMKNVKKSSCAKFQTVMTKLPTDS